MKLNKEQAGIIATSLKHGRYQKLLTQGEIASIAGITRRTWGKLERAEAESASPVTICKALKAALGETGKRQAWKAITEQVEETGKHGLE